MSVFIHYCPTCQNTTNHLFLRIEEKNGSRNIAVVACAQCDDPPYRVDYSSQLAAPTCTSITLTEKGKSLNRELELREAGLLC